MRARVGWGFAVGTGAFGPACSLAVAMVLAAEARAITIGAGDLGVIARIEGGHIEHCDDAVAQGDFLEIFECGDELFETTFNAVDGAGANIGDGSRFSRVPRADLAGPGEWASHAPPRATGPNAASCVACHQGAALGGGGDGPGGVAMNVMRDPLGSGNPADFIQRNTPHLFGMGALQRLAEEMTEELRARFDAGMAECSGGGPVTVPLEAKGVDFGSLTLDCNGGVNTAGVEGVDPDLLVRPFQWKGVEPTVRSFARGAWHNELGMQPVEMTGDGVDGDGDGVVDEISVRDMTASAVYLAAQPRPVSELELNRIRLELARGGASRGLPELDLPVLTPEEVADIEAGEILFSEIGCADCHRPQMRIDDPIYAEPSDVVGYREDTLPAGQPGPAETIRFDLTRDLPDNRFAGKRRSYALGSFERTDAGGAIVRLYGDLKRHDMGPELAENVDETGHGASVWLTKELWGVGSAAEYMHDGRSTTLTEAIFEHGGEAEESRAEFAALSEADAARVVRFLENLVLFFPEAAAAGDSGKPSRGNGHGR